nr:hypothetical protein [Shewanella sp.]
MHPFREGNGRAIRFFFEELVFVARYELICPRFQKKNGFKPTYKDILVTYHF